MKPRDTDRLTFRYVTPDDAALLHALNHAPRVMTYLQRVPPTLDEVVTSTIPGRMQIAIDHPGYGMWLAFSRSSGEFVGRFSLRPFGSEPGEIEIGYGLMPSFWGMGLASEASRELLRYAFEELNANRFVAITMFVNTPSRKVMERIGLKNVRTFHEHFDDPLPGTEKGEVEYALTREEWLARRS